MAVVQACLLLLLALGAAALPVNKTDYCYADITDPYLKFGSKTAYEFIHPSSTTEESIPNCEPVQVWMLCRHGTRFPKKSTIKKLRALKSFRDEIIKNHKSGDGNLCKKDLDNLKAWEFNVTNEQDMQLTSQGEKDLRDLAVRMKKKFPTLLSSAYSPELYEFRYTNTQRTQASTEKFVEGLFGSTEGVYLPPPIDDDPLIQDYSNCTRWDQEVKHNDNATAEASEFKEGDIMNAVKKAVTKRLGFKDKLKYKKLRTMYDMCRFDKAWNVERLSPWCAVFSEDELKVMEYYGDMHSYYEEGYGNKINVYLGCPPVQDFMERFSKLAEENVTRSQEPAGVFYFSHSTMIHMVQAQLGLHKDSEPLLDTNYNSMQYRRWNLSSMGAFTTNIEAVFFKCTEGERNRVKFYESEKPLDIEGCEKGLCSWEFINEKFSSVAEHCNLDICEKSETKSQIRTHG
ncbi:multiple inositol polyphosphate phosphatase 1 [Anabrus simplex]|uniref:multiple inositol polyphosphate phosphatase 1 n=1 Tax=Anabrus simplex TaxID=316456 RepID=UPI0035A33D0F